MDDIEVLIDYEDRDLIRYKWHINLGYVKRARHKSDGPGPKIIYLHRTILERKLGRPIREDRYTDHINRNRLDNCRENLREATWYESARNESHDSVNTSGYRGVSKSGNRWRASIRLDGTRYHLGSRATPEEAYKLYLEATPNE